MGDSTSGEGISMLSLRLVAAGCAVLCLALPAAAAAGKTSKTAAGYDISYPQCGGPFPTKVLFGIVGVNNGIVYSANPCLGAAYGPSELAWAGQYEQPAILYANTGNPGPALSSHWPTGQTFPQYCDPAQTDSAACSYDYGWNAAADSYQRAVDAYVSLGTLSAGATSTPQPNEWWLDVESANSWQQNTAHNVAELQGEADYLAATGRRSPAARPRSRPIRPGAQVPGPGRRPSPTAARRASPAVRSRTASTPRAAMTRTSAADPRATLKR